MDVYTIISVVASIIAVIVSIVSHNTSKAINNQLQLQNNYFELCKKLQNLINLGSENNLTIFKYDIENYTYYDKDSIESSMEFNNIQKKFDEQKMQLKFAYAELMENFDFLYTETFLPQLSKANLFDKWLNENINAYYWKLDKYYGDLHDVFVLVRGAQMGISNPNEKQIIDAFFDNIIDVIRTSQALQILKRRMAGQFKMLSVREINLFKDNEALISNIKKEIYSFVSDYGIDDAIKGTDFSKINKICPGFGVQYDDFINEEKKDYKTFLSMTRNKANKRK